MTKGKKSVYVDVTHEVCWVMRYGSVQAVHDGMYCWKENGYRISGVNGKPWTFKVKKKVTR